MGGKTFDWVLDAFSKKRVLEIDSVARPAAVVGFIVKATFIIHSITLFNCCDW